MKYRRPGILAVRAVNQYRRRDVLPYLGLRYYLENAAAQSDSWARHVATDLVLTRTVLPYFRVYHFKGLGTSNSVERRQILLPGPNEALAEAALLEECARCSGAFGSPSCVFSYRLSGAKDRSGIFEHYFLGLRARQVAVAAACDSFPMGLVQYTDIRRFYPSIHPDLALNGWHQEAEKGKLSPTFRGLGEKLIASHASSGYESATSVLTGPMFSHLLANLVLSELDHYFYQNLPAKYFRYVDDIVLVGEPAAVRKAHDEVKGRLSGIGFQLHGQESEKHIEVSTREWLKARNDYHESRRRISWATLIGDLKRFLLLNNSRRKELQDAFRGEDFRLPVLDYSSSAHEAGFLERLHDLAGQPWFRHKAQDISTKSLIAQAEFLRRIYQQEFRDAVDEIKNLDRFNRKRLIPRLRYRAGRLIYLAKTDTLGPLARLAATVPELFFYSKVMAAISSRNIDELLGLGTNAAQAAAQPLRAAGEHVSMTRTAITLQEEQSLAVFLLNGVQINRVEPEAHALSDLMRFTALGADRDLMRSKDPFIRELACLHGLAPQPRHPEVLESPFDEDEELAMDAIDQLQQSASP